MFMKWKAYHSIFRTWNVCTKYYDLKNFLHKIFKEPMKTLRARERTKCIAGSLELT